MINNSLKHSVISVCLSFFMFMGGVIAPTAFAAGVSGYYSMGYENYNDEMGHSQFLIQYLNLNGSLANDLSFVGYGKWQVGIKNEDTVGELFLGYLEYATFQRQLVLSAGRFDIATNRFMTLDGVSAQYRSPMYFGVRGFVGEPRYKEVQRGEDNFRSTGDVMYGGSVFLSGVEDTKFDIHYSREAGKNDYRMWKTFTETLGTGGAYIMGDNRSYMSIEGIYDQDVYRAVTQRATGRVTGQYDKLVKVSGFGDYFDVQDQYPKDRELVIRLLSKGLETRYGGTVAVLPTDETEVYAGATLTQIKMRGNVENTGQIYDAGVRFNALKDAGLTGFFSGYLYDSTIGTAYGLRGNVDWYIDSSVLFSLNLEQAWIDYSRESKTDDSVFSVDARVRMDLLNSLQMDIYGQAGTNSKFAETSEFGVGVRYAF